MTDWSKYRLMTALVAAAICLPASAKEPNLSTASLRFEVDQKIVDWRTTDTMGRSSRVDVKRGLIEPSHRAELFIANIPFSGTPQRRGAQRLSVDFRTSEAVEKILGTPAGRKISPEQRRFIEGGNAICREGSIGDEVVGRFRFWVYAVSKGDAEKTTQALIQFLTGEAERNMQFWLSERKKLTEESIPSFEGRVSDVEREIKAVQTKLDMLKKTVHCISPEEAMQTVLEFNKILNKLEVEIAGLQAQVSANKDYMTHSNLTNEALTQMQQILGEHTIELAGALARKEAAAKIRDQAKEFYDLHSQLTEQAKNLHSLRKALLGCQGDLREAEDKMADPHGGVLPPEVFENKVVVYPVQVD